MKYDCIWFTGLPGAGKSSLASRLRTVLIEQGISTKLLDADHIRTGLNADIGFTREDRTENVRRLAEVAKLFTEERQIAIVAAISPYRSDRSMAKITLAPFRMMEVHVSTPAAICRARDPKGLYERAMAGHLLDLVGVDIDYEVPLDPALQLDTSELSIEACMTKILTELGCNMNVVTC